MISKEARSHHSRCTRRFARSIQRRCWDKTERSGLLGCKTGMVGRCLLEQYCIINYYVFRLMASTHYVNLSFGQLIPQFGRVIFPPLTCRSNIHVRPINPQADRRQLFVDHDWEDSAIRERFIYIMA